MAKNAQLCEKLTFEKKYCNLNQPDANKIVKSLTFVA